MVCWLTLYFTNHSTTFFVTQVLSDHVNFVNGKPKRFISKGKLIMAKQTATDKKRTTDGQ